MHEYDMTDFQIIPHTGHLISGSVNGTIGFGSDFSKTFSKKRGAIA